ncbi:aminotransferase [Enterovirga sp.]|uniref:aminotransferase n=1 Tax=Enterovirga sp. TaxID=2026350 RepID=UPI0026260532|nr:aminotransferase [Enterovirga sp.]MDB5591270.1 aminotransferase [Enterovirga sp.]
MSAPPAGLNADVLAVASPPIPEARSWAGRYGGEHGPVLDLTQAVPGYPPHPELVRHLSAGAAEAASYGYGNITGDLALRERYAAEVSALYAGTVGPDEVAITTGANMASFAVTMLLARSGDTVMLPVPWYFNHQMNAGLLGIGVVPLPCRAENGFVPDPAEAEGLVGPGTRAVLLVTPNNPTGAVYPAAVIQAFADLCRRRGLWLILDETYREFRADGGAPPHDLFREPWQEHVIQLCSFSKSYCVPGFRAGAVVAGAGLMPELTKILDCLQICAPRVTQAGLAWAIDALRGWREGNRALMAGRAAACRRAFAGLEGWKVDAQGAYFAYLRHPFPERSSWQVAEALAVERGLIALPGAAFGPGQDRYLRLAFANVDEAGIVEAARRLAEA